MKRIANLILGLLLAASPAFSGGLVTNTNQSASWARMLARDASTDIDAVYYNPAGLTKLSDGIHISYHNQSVFQNRELTNSFEYLNSEKFEGKVNAPIFPDFYAAYKKGKIAVSLGFAPIGGGGSAVFDKGVPMIEMPASTLVPMLNSLGVNGYSLDASFEGSSVYFGIQGGVSYAINDMISVYAGARYVWAKNTYVGEMKNVSVTLADGSTVRADAFLNGIATQLSTGATQLSATATAMTPLISSPLGGLSFDNAIAATAGDPATQAQITALRDGLTGIGVSNAGALTLTEGQATYNGYAQTYTEQAVEMTGAAFLMNDQEADVEQTGNGICPILGVNLAFMEDKLNIGIKYEFQTNMELTNSTPAGQGFVTGLNPDGSVIEMFPDGAKTNADIPAMLSIGVRYDLTDALKAQVGYHTYFDKQTGWKKTIGGTEYKADEFIDKNLWEISAGLEYSINDQILVSLGYLNGQTGVNYQLYSSDISYSLKSNTFGIGGAYQINDMLGLEIGAYYTEYERKSLNYTESRTNMTYEQEYYKNNLGIAVGLNFTFGTN